MPTFLAFGSDVLDNVSLSTNGSAGQDGAGQVTIQSGNQLFPDSYILEFEVNEVDANGEFNDQTGFIGVKVYASEADYEAGTATFTYTPQNPGQVANIQNSLDGIGDSYVRFNANVLTSSDSGAPNLSSLFVSPGSDVANQTPATFDRNSDRDYDGSGSIDQSTAEDGNGRFNIQNSSAVCFASGTLIETASGLRLVEDLRIGDLVQTMDNGLQPVIWEGRSWFDRLAFVRDPRLLPISIDLMSGCGPLKLSRQHRLLDARGFFVAAKSLPGLSGSHARLAWGSQNVCYHHILLPKHEIVFANGIAAESLYPGIQAVQAMKHAAREELFSTLPRLETSSVEKAYGPLARPVATKQRQAEVWCPVLRRDWHLGAMVG